MGTLGHSIRNHLLQYVVVTFLLVAFMTRVHLSLFFLDPIKKCYFSIFNATLKKVTETVISEIKKKVTCN